MCRSNALRGVGAGAADLAPRGDAGDDLLAVNGEQRRAAGVALAGAGAVVDPLLLDVVAGTVTNCFWPKLPSGERCRPKPTKVTFCAGLRHGGVERHRLDVGARVEDDDGDVVVPRVTVLVVAGARRRWRRVFFLGRARGRAEDHAVEHADARAVDDAVRGGEHDLRRDQRAGAAGDDLVGQEHHRGVAAVVGAADDLRGGRRRRRPPPAQRGEAQGDEGQRSAHRGSS